MPTQFTTTNYEITKEQLVKLQRDTKKTIDEFIANSGEDGRATLNEDERIKLVEIGNKIVKKQKMQQLISIYLGITGAYIKAGNPIHANNNVSANEYQHDENKKQLTEDDLEEFQSALNKMLHSPQMLNLLKEEKSSGIKTFLNCFTLFLIGVVSCAACAVAPAFLPVIGMVCLAIGFHFYGKKESVFPRIVGLFGNSLKKDKDAIDENGKTSTQIRNINTFFKKNGEVSSNTSLINKTRDLRDLHVHKCLVSCPR